jgi:exosome complex RNA-binding protein Rrp42 (RNase PH superfamily)
MEITSAAVEALEPAAHYDFFLGRGARPDGRAPDEIRPVAITVHPLAAAGTAGSALAVIGPTRVLGSASLQVGTPDLATPLEGDLCESLAYPLALLRVPADGVAHAL